MRLTLRTLLAFLDGVLGGEEADALEAKIAASPVAPKLVERIREAVAKPVLPAPPTLGKGLGADPDTVARYLDNALPGDQIEAFERICLESDMHLAEVASCHAILAEIAADPDAAALDDESLGRLQDVVRQTVGGRGVDGNRAESKSLARDLRRAVDAAAMPSPAAGARKKVPVGAWLSAGVAVVLLLALGGLLLKSLWPNAGKTAGREVAAAPAAAAPPPPGADVPPPRPVDAPAQPAPEVTAVPPPPAGDGGDPLGPPVTPEPQPPAVVPLPVMEGDALGPAAPPEQPVVDAQPPAAPPAGILASGGPLMRLAAADGAAGWETLGEGDPLVSGERFVAAAHAYPRIRCGDVLLQFWPGTLAACSRDADGTPRIEIVFGRCLAVSEAAPARLGISVGRLVGVVALAPRQPVGIEMELLREAGADPVVTPPGRRATLLATGNADWRQTEADGGPVGLPLAGLEQELRLPSGTTLRWEDSDPGRGVVEPRAAPPDWMSFAAPRSRTDRAAAAALTAAVPPGEPAEESLRRLAADRRAENRMAAATTLALLGHCDELVGLLCEDSPARALREGQWRQLEAQVLQPILARGGEDAQRLQAAFEARGPAGRGAELYRLAVGFSAAALAAGGDATLVAQLEDPALVVRRFAIRNLLALVPFADQLPPDYRADRPAALNRDGVRGWRELLEAGSIARPPAATP